MLHSMGQMDRKAHHPYPIVIAPKRYLPLAKVISILNGSGSSSFSRQLKLQRLQDRSGEGMESHRRDRVTLWLPGEGHRHTGAVTGHGEKHPSTVHAGPPSTPLAFLVKACVARKGPREVWAHGRGLGGSRLERAQSGQCFPLGFSGGVLCCESFCRAGSQHIPTTSSPSAAFCAPWEAHWCWNSKTHFHLNYTKSLCKVLQPHSLWEYTGHILPKQWQNRVPYCFCRL